MKANNKIKVYAAFAAVFCVCIIIYAITSPKGDVIVIKSDGNVVETVDLNAVTEEYEITVENAGYNKIKITPIGVKVIEANCPDKLCIEQSEKGIYPIICLPHKLVIQPLE